MKNEIITNLQGVALWTLAHNLGHEWAGSCADRDAIEADGWDAVTSRVTAEMEADEDARSSLPAGIWPARAHTTGSGRISWYTRYGLNTLLIEVNRPAPGLSGSNSVVMRLSAQIDPVDGEWLLTDCESVPSMIELRHLQALAYALYNSADEWYLGNIILAIDDAAFVDRISPIIAAERDRLTVLEAEYQTRCDAYLAEQDRLGALEAEQDRLEA